MDLFTKCNSYLLLDRFVPCFELVQRLHMKMSALVKKERVFQTIYGLKMRGRIDDYVPQRIFFFGFWEPNVTNFMLQAIKPGDYVVDVGSNIGYYTLLMSQLVGGNGGVQSIEASPSTFKILQENITINNCENVRAHNLAASNKTGEIKLFNSKYGVRNTGMATVVEGKGGTDFTMVKCDSLINILGPDVSRTSFIKIDIEGAEGPILDEILKNKDRFATPLIVVSEVAEENLEIVDRYRSEHFECFFLENDYSLGAYLRALRKVETARVKPLDQHPPPAAELIFIYRGL